MGKRRDLTGQKFGSWTVIRRTGYFHTKLGKKTSLSLWLCKCDCGKTNKIPVCNLTTGKTKNCRKCADVKVAMKHRDGDIWDSAFRRKVVNRCTAKGLSYSMTSLEFKEIVSLPCHYCGKEPENEYGYKYSKKTQKELIKLNGIDRVDSRKGYTKQNCVSCCYKCNVMKNVLDYSDFINQISIIYNNLKDKK